MKICSLAPYHQLYDVDKKAIECNLLSEGLNNEFINLDFRSHC